MVHEQTTVVSAPGKVLVAGGYVVLDRQYTGLAIATSARFYCIITPLHHVPALSTTSVTGTSDTLRIRVRAAQFPAESSTWIYNIGVSAGTPGRVTLEQDDSRGTGSNKFIQITLEQTLQYALEHLTWQLAVESKSKTEGNEELLRRLGAGVSNGLDVRVVADNDFYSQREQVSILLGL
jgi:phosphomevalonate kinase